MGTFTGTSGNDTLPGSSGDDIFLLNQGGEDTATGLGGNDVFKMGGTFDAGDSLDGGIGFNQLFLRGDYSAGVTFTATTLTNVGRIALGDGFAYKLTTDDATVASGATMTVDASALASGHALNFDGRAETDGHFHFIDGAGDDVLKGGSGGDAYTLTGGGEDSVTGGSGNDVFVVGGALDAGDSIDGGLSFGTAHDVLRLAGDYSAGLTLGPDTIQNIYTLQFGAGHDYKITVDNANFVSGPTVLVRADALGAGNFLNFDGSASDANFHFLGGAGNDVLTGGTAADLFDLSQGGNDTASGGDLADRFVMGSTLTAADSIDGGAGNDLVSLTGMGAQSSITFSATTMVGVESLELASGHSYKLITNDATVAAGATLTVDGQRVDSIDAVNFDGSAETDGHFILRGGAGDDLLTGGAQSDTFNLTIGGHDTAHGSGGNDTFNAGNALAAGDTIDGGAGTDTLSLDGGNYAGYTFGATQLTSVETLTLAAGHDYDLNTSDANVASGATLTVDASALGAGNAMFFDGAHDSDGFFAVTGGAGDDVLAFGTNLKTQDSYNGGAGNDELTLQGDYTGGYTFGAAQLTSVETLQFEHFAPDPVDNFNITLADGNVAAGKTLIVDGSLLGTTDDILVNAKAETDGFFDVQGNQAQIDFTIGSAAVLAGSTFTTTNTTNSLTLDGDFSGGATLGANQLADIQTLRLAAGNDYTLTTTDGAVQSGATLAVDASALTGTNSLIFGGAAETDGQFAITGGAGNDVLTGGAGADTFDLSVGGTDTVHGGGGNDIVTVNRTLTAADTIDGGTGSDQLFLNGNDFGSDALVMSATTVTNISSITLEFGFSYDITTNDATVAAGQTLQVNVIGGGGAVAIFNGAAETDGHFSMLGGNGDDTLTGGALADSFDMSSGGDDIVAGGGGDDTIAFATAFNIFDQVDGGTGSDTLTLNGTYVNSMFNTSDTTNIDAIDFTHAHNYKATVTGDITGGKGALTLDATGSTKFTLDLSGATSSAYAVTGGTGDDSFTFAGNLAAGDGIDGGAGNDTLIVSGDYSAGVTFTAGTMINVENLVLGAGHDYKFTTNDATVASGGSLTINMVALGTGHTLTLDASAETDGAVVVTAGAAFTAADSFIAGAGGSALILNGDYSGGLVFGATTGENLGDISLGNGFNYNITLNDATAATNMAVDASALTAGHTLTLNAAAETNVTLNIFGGAGNDTITGGQAGDLINIGQGGNDTVHAGSGANEIDIGGALTAADSIDGGGNGGTYIAMAGNYTGANALVLGATTVTHVAQFQLGGGDSYDITTNDATVASGATFSVDASTLGVSDFLIFNGSAETDGSFAILGGSGDDTLEGGNGADTFTGGTGEDTFKYTAVAQSTSTAHDHIADYAAGTDVFNFGGIVGGFDGTVSGSVSTATFDANIGAAFSDAVTLHGDHAWVVVATGGDLNGHSFVVVDTNNNAHYDGGTDYVIDITGFTGTITAGDFI